MKKNNTEEKKIRHLFLVADAHLNGGEEKGMFRLFLDRIATLPEDCAVAFLGDIFDLWLAVPGYETREQTEFLDWCRQEKRKRSVFFIDGNHEFYVAERRKDAFTRTGKTEIRLGNLLLVHGDLINRADWKYRLLRIVLRNPAARFLVFAGKPYGFGPRLAWKIRHRLAGTNMANKKFFPEECAGEFLEKQRKRGFYRIFAGHFHATRVLEHDGCRLSVLPSFAPLGLLARYDMENGNLEIDHYEKIISNLKHQEDV